MQEKEVKGEHKSDTNQPQIIEVVIFIIDSELEKAERMENEFLCSTDEDEEEEASGGYKLGLHVSMCKHVLSLKNIKKQVEKLQR